MDRWLLNAFPLWALVLLVVAVAVTVGVGGFLSVHRFVPGFTRNAEFRTLSSAFSISAGLFSFVLAFTIGQLYNNFTRAGSNAKQEGTAIAQVLRISYGLPPALGAEVRTEALDYAAEVRTHEWKLMRNGNYSVAAWQDIDRMYHTLEAARKRASGNLFYGQTIARVDDLVSARQTRLDDSNLTIAPLFKGLLLLGALLAIYGTFYFKPLGEPLQVVMIGAASTLVGLALLVAISLDYPYSGGITVSSAPFKLSNLLLLSGGR
jgi:hypothetical protein